MSLARRHPVSQAKLQTAFEEPLAVLAGLRQLGGYTLHHGHTQILRTVYLDTVMRGLSRAGVACGVRPRPSGAVARILWPVSVGGGVLSRLCANVRLERVPEGPFFPKGDLARSIRPYGAGRRLVPVAIVEVKRRRLVLRRDGGGTEEGPSAHLHLDRVQVHDPTGRTAPRLFFEVEVEAESGAAEEIEAIATLLTERFPLERGPVPKVARALAMLEGEPSIFGEPPPVVRSEDSLAVAVRKIVHKGLLRLREKDPGTREGGDLEDLHDMRVAVRRLRSGVRLFHAGMPEPVAVLLADELRWLGGVLGEVRDLDVQIERLRKRGDSGQGVVPAVPAGLFSSLEARRALARERLLEALDSSRYLKLLRSLEVFAFTPPTRRSLEGAAAEPIGVAGRRVVAAAMRRVRKQGDRATAQPQPEALHRLRIRAKRLRYVLEFLAELTDKPGRLLVERLVELQDLLGAHQDAVVAARIVQEHLETLGGTADARLLVALGACLGYEMRLAEDLRSHFGEGWRRFRQRVVRDAYKKALGRLATDDESPAERREGPKRNGDAGAGVP